MKLNSAPMKVRLWLARKLDPMPPVGGGVVPGVRAVRRQVRGLPCRSGQESHGSPRGALS